MAAGCTAPTAGGSKNDSCEETPMEELKETKSQYLWPVMLREETQPCL